MRKYELASVSLAASLLLGLATTASAQSQCPIELHVNSPPSGDPQTFVEGCRVQINGVVLTESGCPEIVRIDWDWGDGEILTSFFPGPHTYQANGEYTVTVTPFDAEGSSTSAVIQVSVVDCDATTEVLIDIKPGSYPNSINLSSKGEIPVAILTTDTFEATQVNWASTLFGPNGAIESHGRAHVRDVDEDGDMDMVFHFNNQDTGIQCGDTEATLTGETFGGQAFVGTDAIKVVKCR